MIRMEILADGTVVEHELTPEELAAIEAERQAVAAECAAEDVRCANELTLRERADAALANLEAAWAGWDTLTAAQKDAALKLNVRATAALIRLALRRL